MDDDPLYGGDDDVSNGTPHSSSIKQAFVKHGIIPALNFYLSLTLPNEGEYVRGTVEIKAVSNDDYKFKSYELYVWERSGEKIEDASHLIVSSGEEGINYLLDTNVLKDNIYRFGLKMITQDNDSILLYVQNVIVDNYNDPCKCIVTNKYVFPNEEVEFPVVAEIDEPGGPFCASSVTIENHTLPSEPTVDFNSLLNSWVFSWMAEESDIDKVYTVTFKIIDGKYVVTQAINIYVIKLIRITNSTPYYPEPAISGDYIVWQDYRNGNADIYLYDVSNGKERQITSNPKWQGGPAISGDYIVWHDYRNDSPDIYLYDIAKGEERQITFNSKAQQWPAISGNYIAWQDYRNGNPGIYFYDIPNDEEHQLTANSPWQAQPAISGNYIVWTRRCRDGNCDIYLYDIVKGEERPITFNSKIQQRPAIFGDYIVWEDYRNGNCDIYLYDIVKGEERQITFDTKKQCNPVISSNYIVWEDYRNGNADIYLYDISNGEEQQFTSNSTWQGEPAISGSYIVWGDKRNNDESNIYLAILHERDTTPPSVTIKINNDAEYTTSRDVALTLSATDTGSGMETYVHVQISNDNETWFTVKMLYAALSSPRIYTLPPGDGTKTVYVKFKDVAGNESTASDTIILESSQTPWKSNENGELYTNVGWVSYTMGYRFTPAKNGKIIKLGGYFNGAKTVYLWDSNKKLIASATVNSANNWSYTPITPVKVVAGKTYTVGVYLPGPSKTGSYRYNISTFPKTYGDIKISSSGFYKGNGCPNTVYTYVMYGQVDIGFEPD